MRSVWSLPVARFAGLHFAAWPPKLVRRIVLAGCPPGGSLLDPFLGSGTTAVVAEDLVSTGHLVCTAIGIDISEEFLAIARREILAAREKRAGPRKR